MEQNVLKLHVSAISSLTACIKEFELRDHAGAALPRFAAGAHLRFILPHGEGTLERHYSLINASEQSGTYRIAVHRSPTSRGGSAYMCEDVRVGTTLTAHGPRNDFPLSESASHHLLLAGGIGITPILSMANALNAAGQSFSLHYVSRTAEAMAYAEPIVRRFGERAHLWFDGGDPRRGIPLAQLLARRQGQTHAYVCGPQPMVDAVLATGRAGGWPDEALHFELFGSAAPKAADTSFEVRLARSGLTVQVGREQTILDALIRSGAAPLHDCARGECGVCTLQVLEGEPEHRDFVLTPQQRSTERSMCICVSRARSATLVLDM